MKHCHKGNDFLQRGLRPSTSTAGLLAPYTRHPPVLPFAVDGHLPPRTPKSYRLRLVEPGEKDGVLQGSSGAHSDHEQGELLASIASHGDSQAPCEGLTPCQGSGRVSSGQTGAGGSAAGGLRGVQPAGSASSSGRRVTAAREGKSAQLLTCRVSETLMPIRRQFRPKYSTTLHQF